MVFHSIKREVDEKWILHMKKLEFIRIHLKKKQKRFIVGIVLKNNYLKNIETHLMILNILNILHYLQILKNVL